LLKKGIVIQTLGSSYKVKTIDKEYINCYIKGSLRKMNLKSTNPVAIGDNVEIEIQRDNNTGLITKVDDRRNYIVRKSTNLSKQMHVIAANIDQAVLVVNIINPETSFDFIDRFLASAEAFRIPSIIAVNKYDLLDEIGLEKCKKLVCTYEEIGYKCIVTSVISFLNINTLTDAIKNKTTLFAGNSGVGKSSLINTIEPGLNLKTKEISHYHKTGMHTTSYSELFEIKSGGYVIDTPGLKSFGMYDFEKDEIYHFFPEIFKESKNCKFYNCTHIHEPGCAVITALKSGLIKETRYLSYWNLYNDDSSKYR
jgi:ribosome biogenesis GTPase / thiamine phosphate phosphatase